MTGRKQVFFGWRVVVSAFVSAVFAWGISFYGPAVFLEVLHRTRGWAVTTISAAITLHFLCGAAVVAKLASIHRRLGLAPATRLGAVLMGAGLLGWSSAWEPWQLFPAATVSGAGWAMSSGAALNAMISPWFVRRRPAALGMAFNGASLGGVVFSPLWVFLIGRLGFRAAAGLVAAAVIAVVWTLAGRYLGREPGSMGLAPDGEAIETIAPGTEPGDARAPLLSPWTDARFLTLAGAASLGLFAQIGLVAHLFSYLASIIGEAYAGATMGSVTALAIVGRSMLGAIMPPDADRRLVLAINVAAQALGSAVLLLSGTSVTLLLLGCGLFGLGLGNVTSLPPLVAQAEFRRPDVARIVSLVTATSQASYAFAPAAFGVLLGAFGTDYPAGAVPLFACTLTLQAGCAAVALLGGRADAGKRREPS